MVVLPPPPAPAEALEAVALPAAGAGAVVDAVSAAGADANRGPGGSEAAEVCGSAEEEEAEPSALSPADVAYCRMLLLLLEVCA